MVGHIPLAGANNAEKGTDDQQLDLCKLGTQSPDTTVLPANLPALKEGQWFDDFGKLGGIKLYSPPPLHMAQINQPDDRLDIIMDKLINIESNTSNLSREFSALATKVDNHAAQLSQVKSTTESNLKKIQEVSRKQQSDMNLFDQNMSQKFRDLEVNLQQQNEQFRAEILKGVSRSIQESAYHVQDEILQQQCEARKHNLIIVGLREAKEGSDLKLVKSFFSTRMGIPDIDIKVVYRLGKTPGPKPRPVLVKFAHLGDRNKVWYTKSKIKQEEGSQVWLQEDLPKLAKNAHRNLYRVLKKARSLREEFPDAHIRGQSLIINEKVYRENELESLPEVLRPSNLATLRSDTAVVFFGRASPLSNHHFSPFMLEGHKFEYMEQYLAWRRASLSGIQATIKKTLTKGDALFFKGILNDLASNSIEEWNSQVAGIAEAGLRAKFQQNPALARFLCDTSPKQLGEASQNKRWGIGLTLIHPDVLKTEKCSKEGNLLGRKLMKVREELLVLKNA